jgi:hypothetical protein
MPTRLPEGLIARLAFAWVAQPLWRISSKQPTQPAEGPSPVESHGVPVVVPLPPGDPRIGTALKELCRIIVEGVEANPAVRGSYEGLLVAGALTRWLADAAERSDVEALMQGLHSATARRAKAGNDGEQAREQVRVAWEKLAAKGVPATARAKQIVADSALNGRPLKKSQVYKILNEHGFRASKRRAKATRVSDEQ